MSDPAADTAERGDACTDASAPRELARVLGVSTATALVLGNVIGAGIFVKPGIIAAKLGDFPLIVLAWIVGGVLSIFGGLCFAELAAMLPRAGGLYVYLREAFGRRTAFLFGWNELLFNRPAATGAVSIIFVRSLARIAGLRLSNRGEVLAAMAVVLALAWINVRGVAWGGVVQVATTAVKATFLAGLIALPLVLLPFGASTFTVHNWSTTAPIESGDALTTRFGAVLLAVMWAYNGWHAVAPVAEEIRQPERNVPLALFGGIGLIVALYLGANLVYHGVLSMQQVAASGEHVAEDMIESLLGPAGAVAMAAVLGCSTFGTINGDLLIAPRISFAMGRDRVFFRQLGHVHRKYHTPDVAIGVQAIMASTLVLTTGLLVEFYPSFQQDSVFELLTNFVIFAASIFNALGAAAVIVLRYKHPEWVRPYRTWGYPWVPLAFLVMYAWFLQEVYFGRPFEAVSGLVLIGLGIPVYSWFASTHALPPESSTPIAENEA